MAGRTDLIAAVAALAAHAGIAYGLSSMKLRTAPPPQIVEVEVRKTPPPPVLTPPEPQKPPEPVPEPKRVIVKHKTKPPVEPPAPPPPNAPPPKTPPKDPPKPVFGVTMSSTTESDSSFAVPVGNTTMIDPSKSAKHGGAVTPLPAAPAPQKPSYQPVSELYIKKYPEIDGDACSHGLPYPDEAQQLGIEGKVKLHIELDERGHIHSIKVISGLGHGLDQLAVQAMRKRPECRFQPAIASDGKPAAFALDYTFNFEIDR